MSARLTRWRKPRPCSSAKVPEPSSARPRLFTIPPSAPFLTTLAKAILAGDLPSPGGLPPDPLALPLTTIYLPTRRAARALREAFLAEAKGEALLLPRIRALGDPDEDAAIIFGAEESLGEDGALGEAAIGALPRRLALMRARARLQAPASPRGGGRARRHRVPGRRRDSRTGLLSCRRPRQSDRRDRNRRDRSRPARGHRARGIRRPLAAHRGVPQNRHRALAANISRTSASSRPSRAAAG